MFGHPKTKTMHADCTLADYADLIHVFAFTIDLHVFGSSHKLVFNNISERLLFMIIYAQAVPAQCVTVDML